MLAIDIVMLILINYVFWSIDTTSRLRIIRISSEIYSNQNKYGSNDNEIIIVDKDFK